MIDRCMNIMQLYILLFLQIFFIFYVVKVINLKSFFKNFSDVFSYFGLFIGNIFINDLLGNVGYVIILVFYYIKMLFLFMSKLIKIVMKIILIIEKLILKNLISFNIG